MPKIEKYSFGEIIIDGKRFTKDIIITPNEIRPNWWRNEGHQLAYTDLEDVISSQSADVLVIGTGKFGMMTIPQEVRDEFVQRKIKVVTENTDKAVKLFNELNFINKADFISINKDDTILG